MNPGAHLGFRIGRLGQQPGIGENRPYALACRVDEHPGERIP
ncbi:hypothetical protein MGAST_20950 [Mycobacterium gastri 'Wayne']|nr:hypothetical protein MGAST_20950 [Mycobacterium gastri 'Wayne']